MKDRALFDNWIFYYLVCFTIGSFIGWAYMSRDELAGIRRALRILNTAAHGIDMSLRLLVVNNALSQREEPAAAEPAPAASAEPTAATAEAASA